MAAVLVYTAENMIESFLEPVLDLLAALIDFDRGALADGTPGAPPYRQQRCVNVLVALRRILTIRLQVLPCLRARADTGMACSCAHACTH